MCYIPMVMLNALYITEYSINVHTKNKQRKDIGLISLKRWCFSMLLKCQWKMLLLYSVGDYSTI